MSTEEKEETEASAIEETEEATTTSEEESSAEEYLPTEEEVTTPSTSIDDVSLDVMITVGDTLRKAALGELDINEAVNIISEVRSKLVRKVSRAKVSRRRKRR